MFKREIVVVVRVRVGFVDIVDSNQVVEFVEYIQHCLCGGGWGLTLSNLYMQSL